MKNRNKTRHNANNGICNACGKKVEWETMSELEVKDYIAFGVCKHCNKSQSIEWEDSYES
jgi:DNA-directed RNA polymerase subunit RPC12/RpoP